MAVLGLCVLAPPALAKAGNPDHSFGGGGTIRTAVDFPTPWQKTGVQLAEAPGGELAVAGGETLARYLPDGQLDPSFGEGGLVGIVLPEEMSFSLGDLAIDGQGRTIVIGTAGDPNLSYAAILRYTRDGKLDPSFGGGDGVVMTNFGLPFNAAGRAPAVTATLGAVDAQDRITLIAGTIQPESPCGGRPHLGRSDPLIVRLTPSGDLDPSFGSDGISSLAPLETVADMAFEDNGEVVVAGVPRSDCDGKPDLVLTRLRSDGSRNEDFGVDGLLRRTGTVVAIALDDRGRILVLGRSKRLPAKNESVTTTLRLLPSGRLDKSFSGGWTNFWITGTFTKMSALAVDSNGRPLLIGTLIRPTTQKNPRPFHRAFVVAGLHRSGQIDRSFGWLQGISVSHIGWRTDAVASAALIDTAGQLVIAGAAHNPVLAPQGAFGLARFELGP